VQWNGAARATTFVSDGELRAAIGAADLAAAGQAAVTVVNPGTSSGPSNALSFVIADPTKQGQTIAFGPLPNRTIGGGPFEVTATASSGLPVSFTASGVCSVAGNLVTPSGAGACTITARQPGDATYNPAPDVARTFQVTAGPAAPSTWSLYLPIVTR
jgi:hypothetical protein